MKGDKERKRGGAVVGYLISVFRYLWYRLFRYARSRDQLASPLPANLAASRDAVAKIERSEMARK